MNLLGSRSSRNFLIRKRVQTGEKTSATENQDTTQPRKQTEVEGSHSDDEE